MFWVDVSLKYYKDLWQPVFTSDRVKQTLLKTKNIVSAIN